VDRRANQFAARNDRKVLNLMTFCVRFRPASFVKTVADKKYINAMMQCRDEIYQYLVIVI
jgi:hypothetical protein